MQLCWQYTFHWLHLGAEKKCSSATLVLINFGNSSESYLWIPSRTSFPLERKLSSKIFICSRLITKELMDLLNQDRSPLCNTKPAMILDQNIQRHLTHFSLITHGFGSPAIVAALTAIQVNTMKNKTKSLKSRERRELKLIRWMIINVNWWLKMIDD